MSSTSTLGEPLGDPVPQPARVAERGVGGRADDEAAGDGQARGRQLAEVRALAPRVIDVTARELRERTDRIEALTPSVGSSVDCDRGLL